ncbi:MAG: hypothetical protein LUE64_06585 [Candidatus Gastranaerophilales bacterium]|nr:hypothetical protein [Candidatus Gastranaerophilales bacterium]
MKVFNVVANTAAIASIISIGLEAGQMGARTASKSAKTAGAVKDIRDYTADSKLNKSSEKYNAMKEFTREHDFTYGLYKAGGAVTGFAKGVSKGLKGNIPTLGFSALTLLSKNKTIKTASIVGMGVSLAWDFIRNGTSLFRKKDQIE